MRVNIYAEEMSKDFELVTKKTADGTFTGIRLYLYLPVTTKHGEQIRGPFHHHKNDDDSSAITFWGKKDLKEIFKQIVASFEYYERFGIFPENKQKAEEVHYGSSDGVECNSNGTSSDINTWQKEVSKLRP